MTIDLTTRLGLTKDSTGEQYDVGRVNANTQKIDDNIGAIICTSSTRPSTPYAGMHIFETDTGFSLVWRADLSAWAIPRTGMYAAGARPTTGLYEGYTIYRTDKDFHETYDGALWRVIGTQTVAALADITNPKTGQLALLTTDNFLYRWSGSTWIAVLNLFTGGSFARYYQNAAHSIPTTTNTAFRFQVAQTAHADVTPSGTGNSIFTLNRGGRWTINATGVIDSNTSFRAVEINDSTFATRYAGDSKSATATSSTHHVSLSRSFSAGSTISLSGYQTGGAVNTLPVSELLSISFKWDGP